MADQKRKAQLAVGLDSQGVKDGAKQAGDALHGIAADAQKAAADTNAAVGSMGAGVGGAAAKLDSGTRSIINSIRRSTAEVESFGKGQAAYFDSLARLRGIPTDAIAPYITKLREAEAAQAAARRGMDGMALTAKELTNATRQLPAQFTDIAVSLAAGQNPLTVFLQQGGQLKDVFGGIGPAARAMGGYILGLVNPFTVAAAAAVGLFAAFNAGQNEISELNKKVILSGEAIGKTAGQLQDMAKAIAATGAGTQGRAAEILGQFAETGAAGVEGLKRYTQAALELERVGGPAAEETAKAFSELAKDPVKAALKLNETTNFLTKSVYEQAKSLDEQGKSAQAAKVLMDAYSGAIEQRAPQIAERLGTVERAWLAIKKAAATALDQIKGIGRDQTTREQLDAVQAAIRRVQEAPAGDRFRDADGRQVAGKAAALESLRQREGTLQEQLRLEERSAEASAQYAASVKARVELDKEADKYLDKRAQKEREIAAVRELMAKAGKDDLEAQRKGAEAIKGIEEKFKEAPKKIKPIVNPVDVEAFRAYVKAFDDFQRVSVEATRGADSLSKTQSKLLEIQGSPVWAQYSRQQQEQIIFAASLSQADEDRGAAMKDYRQSLKDAQQEYQKFVGEFEKGAESAEQQLLTMERQRAAQALIIPGYFSEAQAIQQVALARLQERRELLAANPLMQDAVDAIDREIEARKKLVSEIGQKDRREAEAKSAEEARKEWERTANQIEQSLTDALLRGFESGKSFAVNLRDTVVNLFKTMVLKPVISAVINPVAGAISSAVGGLGLSALSGAANAAGAGGLGALGSGIAGLSSMGSAFGAGFLSTLQGGTLAGGQAAGLLAGGAGAGTSIAGAIGAAAPYALAAAAVYNLFIKDKDAKLGFGAASIGQGGIVSSTGRQFGFGRGDDTGQQSTLSELAKTIGTAIANQAQAFGGTAAGIAVQAATDIDRKGGGSGVLGIVRNGQVVGGVGTGNYNPADPNGKDVRLPDAKDLTEWFRSNSSKAIIAGLQQSNLPARFKEFFSDIASASLTEQDANALLATASGVQSLTEGLKPLGGIFSQLGGLSIGATNDLAAMVGGLDAFASKAQAYVQAFYSRDEIAGIKAAELQVALRQAGITQPVSTKDEFRALVDGIDVSTKQGQEQLATLLNIAGSFAEVADYIAETGNKTLGDVAAQAPADGALIGFLTQQTGDPAATQVEAIVNVETAVTRVGNLVQELIDVVKSPNLPGFGLEYENPGGA